MLKKRVFLILSSSLAVAIIFLLAVLSFVEPLFYVKFTGKAVDSEAISIGNKKIEIQSPENKTYFIKDKSQYNIDLNVSANFEVEKWQYTLLDPDTGEIAAEDSPFIPGSRISVSRWNNQLTVRALDPYGEVIEESVEFYISSSDSFPVIENLESPIYICEGGRLDYPVTVRDPEAEKNPGPIELIVEPSEIFYITPARIYPSSNQKETNFSLASKKLTKEDAGGIDKTSKTYERTISANDGRYFSLNKTRIIVIEKNNPPKIQRIGAKTEVVKWKGDNTINYRANVLDVEDGNQNSGNLRFEIEFSGEKLFEINSNGLMNLNYDESHIGVYNITICVTDTGIDKPHTKISEVCGQTGSDQRACTNFSLAILKNNNPPTITENSPRKLDIETEKSTHEFNITVFDPDKNPPDVYWYVDDELVSYTSGLDLKKGFSEIRHSFGCEGGPHSVNARITDGTLNDTVEWKIRYLPKSGCEETPECEEKWGCEQWKVCQSLKKSVDAGILTEEDYQRIQDECVANKWNSENCGFQIRECINLNECNTTVQEPEKIQRCYFTENPNCEDGIKNCHTRDCEVLTDCGGPCKPCPTCYDGIQNQGEEDIDCGGPCYLECEVKESPFVSAVNPLRYILTALIIILIIVIGFKIMKISKIRKQIKKQEESYRW
jgi:hypothetical protein